MVILAGYEVLYINEIEEAWQYYFYVDLEYESYQSYQNMIRTITEKTTELKILGNYKKGKK